MNHNNNIVNDLLCNEYLSLQWGHVITTTLMIGFLTGWVTHPAACLTGFMVEVLKL